jgi:hypothetical protein
VSFHLAMVQAGCSSAAGGGGGGLVSAHRIEYLEDRYFGIQG